MSYSNKIEELKQKLNLLKNKYQLINEKSGETIPEIADSFNLIVSKMDLAYDWYFNDLKYEEDGKEMNFSNGNNYSTSIQDEYVYPEIRFILLDHLNDYIENKKAMNLLNSSIDIFDNDLNIIQEEFNKFEKSYIPPPPEPPTIDPITGEIIPPPEPPTASDVFWEEKGGASKFNTSIEKVINTKNILCGILDSLKNNILDWLYLGELISKKISRAFTILSYKDDFLRENETLYDMTKKSKNAIDRYCPELLSCIDIVDHVLLNHKEPDNTDENIEIDFNIKTVKKINNMMNNFNNTSNDEQENLSIEDEIKIEIYKKEQLKQKSEILKLQILNIFEQLHGD